MVIYMVLIKSFSVENGDMFYIYHGSDNFTIIDCNLVEERESEILNELYDKWSKKTICRFISTHPDKDHIYGIEKLNELFKIKNFYCVENSIHSDGSSSFEEYCNLRNSKSSFFIYKKFSNYWLNKTKDGIESSGIFILWPDTSKDYFKEELEKVENGEKPSFNNISPIIEYSLNEGVTCLWFGDLEVDFLNKINNDISIPNADIIFAPHHGRDSSKIPKDMLDKINPKIIVIGEADSEHLNYYEGFNTITQNSAKDIVFECIKHKVHIFTTNAFNNNFLDCEKVDDNYGLKYRGTLNLD